MLRYNPEQDTEPHFQTFEVPFTDDTSVLQGLQYIKDHLDGSLTFRWSCRMAICGSCGKMVNGKPELSCHTFLRDYYPGPVRIEPLNHFPIAARPRDRPDATSSRRSCRRSSRTSSRTKSRPLSAGTHVQTPAQFHKYYQYSQCINCLLCYAACPQYGLKPGLHRAGGARAAAPLQRRLARPRLGRARGGPQRRGRRVGLHAGRLLLGGVPEGRRSRARHQPEQGQQHDGLFRRAEAPHAEGRRRDGARTCAPTSARCRAGGAATRISCAT